QRILEQPKALERHRPVHEVTDSQVQTGSEASGREWLGYPVGISRLARRARDNDPMVADPKRTSVLAVGLEYYGFGPEPGLPRVAPYAVRFAKWAIERGVPPSRVRLACAWGQEPAPTSFRDCTDVQPTSE